MNENNTKKRSKPLQKNLQLIKKNKVVSTYAPKSDKPIKINKVKDAKRLLSKLIYQFQIGAVDNQDAKDLTYLLVNYVNICVQTDFEQRLEKLEKDAK